MYSGLSIFKYDFLYMAIYVPKCKYMHNVCVQEPTEVKEEPVPLELRLREVVSHPMGA